MNRFIVDFDNLIIKHEETKKPIKQDTYRVLEAKVNHLEKLLNGGPGSGNFGHYGRPGKVGGSSPRDNADMAFDLEEYLKYDKRRVLRARMRRMNIDQFDKDFEKELADAGFTKDEVQQFRVIVAMTQAERDDKKAKQKELRARAKGSEEQTKAVDNIVHSIIVQPKDETWLRNNCSPEMAQAFSDEIEVAKEMGVDVGKVKLRLNDATKANGSMGYHGLVEKYFTLTISKKILRDYEWTQEQRNYCGPENKKWWTSSSVNGTFSHEFGHAMNTMFCLRAGLHDSHDLQMANYIVIKAKENLIGAKYSDRDKWTSTQRETADSLKMNKNFNWISEYGQTNAMEVIAESFANPNYSKLTKEVYKITKSTIPKEKIAEDMGISVEKLESRYI